MEKGTSRASTGPSASRSTDILSRIRATAASKPETKIRQLEHALSMAQAELVQLKEEQEALAEAYVALEKERDGDVQKLKTELEKLMAASAVLEKERDGWRSAALSPEPIQELNEKDTSASGAGSGSGSKSPPTLASQPPSRSLTAEGYSARGNEAIKAALEDENENDVVLGTIHAGQSPSTRIVTIASGTTSGGFMSHIQATLTPTPEQSARQLKDKIRQLSAQLAETKEENQGFRSQHTTLTTAFEQVQLERNRFKEATLGQESELSVLRTQLQDAKNLAAIRGKELMGTQVFLTKADSLTVGEVVEKVSNLNEEIFQAAALLGEYVIFDPNEITPHDFAYCARILGDKLTTILVNESKKNGVQEANPFLAQVVFQVYLVSVCHRLVESWQPDDPTCATFIEAIYTNIHASEQQLVAGRWRALTRTHSRPTTGSWKGIFLVDLSRVCKLANWSVADEASRADFETKLPRIFKAVEELRRAIGERFMSADFHLTTIGSEQSFNGEHMEDAYETIGRYVGRTEGRSHPPEIVLGTVAFGLKRALEGHGVVGFHSVQHPKVALASAVMEALAPPPPRQPRSLKKVKGKS